jgi:hypothetical protein
MYRVVIQIFNVFLVNQIYDLFWFTVLFTFTLGFYALFWHV